MGVFRKDREKISYPSVTNTANSSGGSVANIGDMNGVTIHLQTAQNVGNVDLKDFQEKLNQFRRELLQANLEPTLAQDLEAEVQGVQEQIEREKPSVPMILGKVKTITDVLSTATDAAKKLAPMARMLGEMAAAWV